MKNKKYNLMFIFASILLFAVMLGNRIKIAAYNIDLSLTIKVFSRIVLLLLFIRYVYCISNYIMRLFIVKFSEGVTDPFPYLETVSDYDSSVHRLIPNIEYRKIKATRSLNDIEDTVKPATIIIFSIAVAIALLCNVSEATILAKNYISMHSDSFTVTLFFIILPAAFSWLTIFFNKGSYLEYSEEDLLKMIDVEKEYGAEYLENIVYNNSVCINSAKLRVKWPNELNNKEIEHDKKSI